MGKDKSLDDLVAALLAKKCSCSECGHGSCGCKSRGFPCTALCGCKGESGTCTNPLQMPKLNGIKYHVFLSCEKENVGRVGQLKKCLVNWGIDVFLDEAGKVRAAHSCRCLQSLYGDNCVFPRDLAIVPETKETSIRTSHEAAVLRRRVYF